MRILKILIITIFLLNVTEVYSNDYGVSTLPSFEEDGNLVPDFFPTIPIVPIISVGVNPEDMEGKPWRLEKTFNLLMEKRVNVVVPLEIVSDVDIKAMVIDNQILEIPFEIEMNREPERMDYYSLNFSETEIDIDGDGKIDTRIYSPKYINKKIVDENKLVIEGENISVEGVHRKRVYITVEIKDGER